jgi:hypothetical protein
MSAAGRRPSHCSISRCRLGDQVAPVVGTVLERATITITHAGLNTAVEVTAEFRTNQTEVQTEIAKIQTMSPGEGKARFATSSACFAVAQHGGRR